MTQLSRTAQAKLAAEIQAAAPAKEWDQIAELRKWKESITLKGGEKKSMNFRELVEKSLDLKSEIEYREKIRKEIQIALEAAMLIADEKVVVCEGYPVNLVTRAGSRKIVPEKLLELGVSADTIAKATVISDGSTFVQIGKPRVDKF
jgi:hypothetical protein